ncbi:MAG TPA: hypothetical protein VF261_02115 [Candidatus Saccharimonadales bacterium]
MRRFDLHDLPPFMPDHNERLASIGWLQYGDNPNAYSRSLRPVNQPGHSRFDSRIHREAPIIFRFGIARAHPGESEHYTDAENVFHAARALRFPAYRIEGADYQTRRYSKRLIEAYNFMLDMKRRKLEEQASGWLGAASLYGYAIAATPTTSDAHASPQTRVAHVAGLGIVEDGGNGTFDPRRLWLEAVVESPMTGEIGLLPRFTTVSGRLYSRDELNTLLSEETAGRTAAQPAD